MARDRSRKPPPTPLLLIFYSLPPPWHALSTPPRSKSGSPHSPMRCNSSALTGARRLSQGLLPHTHLPTGSSFRCPFPAPAGLRSRCQIPREMALYQGKGRAPGRGAGLWVVHRSETASPGGGKPGEGGEERTLQQLQHLEEISRGAPATG